MQSISVAKWKVAREMLPLAREWANSHRLFLDAEAKVTANLGNLSQRESRPDYLQIRRALAAAEAAIPAGFKAVAATERFLSDGEYQANWRDAALTLERRCIEWREGADEGAVPDLDHAPFEQTAADLERQLGLLADADELFDMQSHVLGAEATFGQNIDGALARLHFEKDHLAAQERRAELEALLQLPPDSLGLELGAEVPLRDHSNWARRVLELSRVPDGQPLTKDQLRVLRSTDPFYGVEAPVERYLAAKQKLLAAFDSGRVEELSLDLDNVEVASELIDLLNSRLEEIDDWFELQSANESSERLGLSAALNHARRQALPVSELGRYLKSTVYRAWLNLQIQADPRLVSPSSARRDQIVDEFRRLDTEIAQSAVARIIESASARRPKSSVGQAALIRREAEKKRRHIPVRDLIGQARDVILAMHPCFMMSPLAVSQYLPPEEMFDVVIFDEASQVMPADSINCIYRARAVVTAGDQKQLPPTSFFEATPDESDDADDEDLANDYESILDLMKSSGAFTAQSLRWHYRSRHEHLIAYSNASFYQSRLITFPSAVSESDDIGVRFFKVPGVYRRSAARDNPVEARHVAERVIHHFDTRPGQSLGVVAFSTAQRDAIDAAVDLARGERPDLDGYFTEERGSGFFVKSLESVQGDERDVIIFSIGYGPDENGKIFRTFGPVSRNGGERRLNVAVTRAKRLVEVVSSISASDIGEVGSEGGRHLRRYLDFAERGPVALSLELGSDGLETESPFEDAVLDYVRGLGFEVQPQVGVAGYRIDLGVKHPNQPGAFMLGIECDGAAYHSSKAARDRDRIRHQVLEGLGWNIHHIWGTAWYRHPEKEKQRLKKLLEEAASRPVSGRLSPQRPAPVNIVEPVELGFVEHQFDVDPDWVTDYAVAEVERIPYRIDLSDTGNGMWLRRFVEAVARVEAPLHFDVLMLRLRENSQYDRIGSKIRQTLVRATKLADVEFDGEWIRRGQSARVVVRRPAGGFTRTVSQVPEEELQSAIVSLVADAVGVRQSDLVVAVASIFGWRRTGPDIRTRLHEVVAGMLERGTLIESSGGLSLGR